MPVARPVDADAYREEPSHAGVATGPRGGPRWLSLTVGVAAGLVWLLTDVGVAAIVLFGVFTGLAEARERTRRDGVPGWTAVGLALTALVVGWLVAHTVQTRSVPLGEMAAQIVLGALAGVGIDALMRLRSRAGAPPTVG